MRFLRIIFNKYLLVTAGFLALIIFFDQNDLLTQRERQQELKDVQDNITFLKGDIAKMQSDYKALTGNPRELERYAREKYRMKRDSEDLYIVERK